MHPHRWLLVAKTLCWPAIPKSMFRAAQDLAAALLGPAQCVCGGPGLSSQSDRTECARRESGLWGKSLTLGARRPGLKILANAL